jgi:hypothetical protein
MNLSLSLSLATGRGAGQPYHFAGTRLVDPQSFLSVSTSARQYAVSQVFVGFPDYPTRNPRFYFPNWILGGTGVQEQDPGNSKLVQAAAFVYGGTAYPITFAGQTSVTIASGGGVWSDPVALSLPADASGFVRTADFHAMSDNRAGMYRMIAGLGEVAQSGSSDLSAKVMAGGISGGGSVPDYYGPSAMIVQGTPAGRPVVLTVGDSIGYGNSEPVNTADARGNRGYLHRGLDGLSNSAVRIPYKNCTVPGAKAVDVTSIAAGAFRRRDEMIQAARAFSGGALPFTCVLSEMGTNDNQSDATAWKATLAAYYDFFTSRYGVRVVAPTLAPRTAVSATSKWTNLADQTVNANYLWPGNGQTMHDWIATGAGGHLTAGIDAQAAWDGGSSGKIRVDVTAFTTTLASASIVGASSFSLTASPPAGSFLVFDVNTASAEALQVVSVTGTGPYTVTVNGSAANAHSAGATLLETPTIDGLHFSGRMHQYVATNVIEPAKAAGAFG